MTKCQLGMDAQERRQAFPSGPMGRRDFLWEGRGEGARSSGQKARVRGGTDPKSLCGQDTSALSLGKRENWLNEPKMSPHRDFRLGCWPGAVRGDGQTR